MSGPVPRPPAGRGGHGAAAAEDDEDEEMARLASAAPRPGDGPAPGGDGAPPPPSAGPAHRGVGPDGVGSNRKSAYPSTPGGWGRKSDGPPAGPTGGGGAEVPPGPPPPTPSSSSGGRRGDAGGRGGGTMRRTPGPPGGMRGRKTPGAGQRPAVWLEYSKLEEECGRIPECTAILKEGLGHCRNNENLIIRAVKYYERIGDLDEARSLLSICRRLPIERMWKTMLEGALLESRAGNYGTAREFLKYLTHHVPWYGPLYLAHTKLERDHGLNDEAFGIVEKGLRELPRYGPLYFQAFKLLEKSDLAAGDYGLPRTMDMVERASTISRELLWKVHLEAAQMQERAALAGVAAGRPAGVGLDEALRPCRRSYARSIALCPPNLTWKIWLAAGRTEVSCDNVSEARELFLRAHDCVTEKGRSSVLLELSRLEEFAGDVGTARSFLTRSRGAYGGDWKVWLSSVNLECRHGRRDRAIEFAQSALNIHRGTGRLWAALIQLRHDDGELRQMDVFRRALQSVPKSGEVWCEGARIRLDPLSPTFDAQAAMRHLSFAARFTPQYGDSFLEQVRVDMIDRWLVPLAEPHVRRVYGALLPLPFGGGGGGGADDGGGGRERAYGIVAEEVRGAVEAVEARLRGGAGSISDGVLDTSDLELRCSSADPNYGHLWFKYRDSPIDTAREVIMQAKEAMTEFTVRNAHVYIGALVRRAGLLMLVHKEHGGGGDEGGLPRQNTHEWNRLVDAELRRAPDLAEMAPLEGITSKHFVVERIGASCLSWSSVSAIEKKDILFGSDAGV